ncbi:hypothetical protein SGPA1_30965 [Streptomyces misionensis JCM 4497]
MRGHVSGGSGTAECGGVPRAAHGGGLGVPRRGGLPAGPRHHRLRGRRPARGPRRGHGAADRRRGRVRSRRRRRRPPGPPGRGTGPPHGRRPGGPGHGPGDPHHRARRRPRRRPLLRTPRLRHDPGPRHEARTGLPDVSTSVNQNRGPRTLGAWTRCPSGFCLPRTRG